MMRKLQSALMNILQTSQIVLILTPLFKEFHEQQPIDQIVFRAIDEYKDSLFEFSLVSPAEVMKQIDLLENSKSSLPNNLV